MFSAQLGCWQVRAEYDFESLIPDKPAEPWQEEASGLQGRAVRRFPFVSAEPSEAAEQRRKLQAAGCALPEFM